MQCLRCTGTAVEAFHALPHVSHATTPQGGNVMIPVLQLGEQSHVANKCAELGFEAMFVFKAHAFNIIPHFK